MMPIVVDACVWVEALDVGAREHASSAAFLRAIAERGDPVLLPTMARVEVGCAIRRRTGDRARALAGAEALMEAPQLREVVLDRELASRALARGAALGLRATDAVYAAIATHAEATLVSLDRELLERAGGITPAEWLQREGTG